MVSETAENGERPLRAGPMPVAKLSPISQATISITPWMPKVIIRESTGSLVKLRMPSQVVQPEATDSTMPVRPSTTSRQLVRTFSSSPRQMRRKRLDSRSVPSASQSANRIAPTAMSVEYGFSGERA
ncbi:MAG: hypothetical protein AB7E70_09325 [Hyphomicrobiaceae bacterium]